MVLLAILIGIVPLALLRLFLSPPSRRGVPARETQAA